MTGEVIAHTAPESTEIQTDLAGYAGHQVLVSAQVQTLPNTEVLDARRMFFTDIRPYRGGALVTEDVRLLVEAAKLGHRAARDKLLFANVGMIIDSAKQYVNLGLDELELIAEGSVEFWSNVHRYNVDSEASLATYMRYWVRRAQSKAVRSQGRRIYIPPDVQTGINQVQRARWYVASMGATVTPAMVAAEIGLDASKAQELMEIADRESSMISLDAPLRSDDERPLGDYLTASDSPEREVIRSLAVQDIRHEIAQLTYDQRLVITLRHGIVDGRSRSEQEVAKALNITRARVRKLERAAYACLKPNLRPDMLQV